ncbi:MAG: phosphate signaling complex protein PhoU [Polyangiaceae bacterium]
MAFATGHTSRAFESELDQLRSATRAMGERTRLALRTALEAFRTGSRELAGIVRELDGHVDRDEMAIDALALRILATRQPVASDLRLLAMALKMVTDLERIGDEAVNIADRVEDGRCSLPDDTRAALEQMCEEAQTMVSAALEAFLDGDEERAREVLVRDDIVDDLYGRTMRGTERYMMDHPSEIQAALCVMSIGKYVERIADHATNIAEEVVFVVRGEDVRHQSSVVGVNER